jgi:MFS family permease
MNTLHLLTAPAARRTWPRRPRLLAFAVVAAIDAIAFYASATPSPLYGIYQSRWHFSTPVLTLVYATYAVGVLAALLLVGGISDQTGRRPVLALSLVGLLGSMGLFLAADSVGWLFAARALQGLATGAALGAAGAALLEFHPTGDARRVALVTGAVNLSGLGAGALLSSLLVDLVPAPRVVPYIVVVAAILLLLGLIATLPEPVSERRRPRLRRTLTSGGAVTPAAGLVLTAAAVSLHSAVFFLLASAVAGVGVGVGFMGALRQLAAVIPAERRGEVMSAFYIGGYLSLSLPAIGAGFAATAFGLSTTFEMFSAVVVPLALAVAIGGLAIERAMERDRRAALRERDAVPMPSISQEQAA